MINTIGRGIILYIRKIKLNMKWLDSEIEIVKNYNDKIELLELLPNRTWDSIRKIRSKLVPGKVKLCIKWIDQEINILIANYENMIKENLEELLPNRTWDSIKLKANNLKLNRSYDFIRQSNMSVLLDDNKYSFYWVGFLLADGHISDSKRIKLEISIKDIQHLEKFASYIRCDNISKYNKMCRVSFQNIDICEKLCKKFKIVSNKTHNPMDFNKFDFSRELIFSLIVGFIDGDGCISRVYKRQDCNIRIHLHKSWLKNLIFIENFLYDYFNIKKTKIYSTVGNDGYSTLTLSDNNVITKIKKECIKLGLSIMNRKWDKIDENKISRNVKFNEIKENIIEMYKNNYSALQIIEILNIKKGVVYKHIRNYEKVLINN